MAPVPAKRSSHTECSSAAGFPAVRMLNKVSRRRYEVGRISSPRRERNGRPRNFPAIIRMVKQEPEGLSATSHRLTTSGHWETSKRIRLRKQMRNWSIPAGRVFGVEIRIHLSFLLLLLFVALSEQGARVTVNPLRGVALVAIIFGSVVLHELGHALVGRRSGVPPRAIVLLPIGGVTIFDEAQPALPANWKRDARIAAAGPMVNFVIAGISAVFLGVAMPQWRIWADPYVSSSNLPHSMIWANLWLGLFNLLPAYPMDGGRVLRAIFSRSMEPMSATRRAVSIGRGFAIAFVLAGLWNVWFSVIGVFLVIAAQMEDRSAGVQSLLETMP